MPLLNCKLGDFVRSRRIYDTKKYEVKGFHTVSGDLYLESQDQRYVTVTSKTAHLWHNVGQKGQSER